MVIRISSAQIQMLLDLAAAEPGREVCGLLLEAAGGLTIVPTANVAGDPRRHFEIDPGALIAALKSERAGGSRVLGYYHSHPRGPAAPSETDARLGVADGRVWIVIGEGEVRAWTKSDRGFEAVAMAVID